MSKTYITEFPNNMGNVNVGTTGIMLTVDDNNGKKIGRLCVTNTGVEWLERNSKKNNGVKKNWKELKKFFDS